MSLQSKRIVVTRSRGEQNEALCDRFAKLGACPIAFPVIQFEPLNPPALETAVSQIEQYDWLLFTSVNAVQFFWEGLSENGQSSIVNGHLSIGAVGSATLKALETVGLTVDFVPDQFSGEALVKGLGELNGKRVLLPRAKIGRPEIVAMLEERGAIVDDIALYDTVTAVPTPEALAELQAGYDVLTFTSPSSVRNFLRILGERETAVDWEAVVACIGPVTTEEAEKKRFTVQVQPEEYTIAGLVGAVADYFG